MNPHILVVDDTPTNTMLARAALGASYEVTEAADGLAALKILESLRPDLILLDIMMPRMNGLQFCEKLKANPELRDIPIIFLTALEKSEDIVKGFEVGAVDYITKPFRIAELRARVNTQIKIKQNVEEIGRLRREHEAFLRHELNNRLMPIKGYADLLLFAQLNLDEKHSRMLERMSQQTDGLVALVQSMKDLEDLESGTYKIAQYPVDIKDILQNIIEDLSVEFDTVQTHFDTQVDKVTVTGDSNLLVGAFQNLIKNAFEHVKLEALENDRQVHVSLSKAGDRYFVHIQNGGVPIPPERLSSFFHKFNTDRSQKSGGTGLGTTYAYWVVRAHGGEIGVASNEHEGTTVTVALPCEDVTK